RVGLTWNTGLEPDATGEGGITGHAERFAGGHPVRLACGEYDPVAGRHTLRDRASRTGTRLEPRLHPSPDGGEVGIDVFPTLRTTTLVCPARPWSAPDDAVGDGIDCCIDGLPRGGRVPVVAVVPVDGVDEARCGTDWIL